MISEGIALFNLHYLRSSRRLHRVQGELHLSDQLFILRSLSHCNLSVMTELRSEVAPVYLLALHLCADSASSAIVHICPLSLHVFLRGKSCCHFTSRPDEILTGPSSNIPCFTTFTVLMVHYPAAFKERLHHFHPSFRCLTKQRKINLFRGKG